MPKIFRILSLSAFVLLSACSYIKKQNVIGDQEKAYRNAKADTVLSIPADLPHTQIGSQTETLPANIPAKSLSDVPLPPGSLADQVATGKTPKSALDVKLPDPK